MQPLQTPRKVRLDLTSRCLLRCQHCHIGEVEPPDGLSFGETCRLVDDLAAMRVPQIELCGGEPFLRPDIVEIIRHICTASPGRVMISTSGLMLGEHTLAALYLLREHLTLKIALNGPPKIHDKLCRRDGAFAAAYESLCRAVHLGFEVQVTTTLMRANVAFVEEMISIVQRTGCSRHNLQEVLPVGAATRKMVLSREERLELVERISRAKERLAEPHDRIVVNIPFAAGPPQESLCRCGISECSILSDGRVVGCALLPQWVAGNVRERPFAEIWADPQAFAQFRQVTAKDCGQACATCPSVELCRGGCRVYALGLTGDLWAADPRCSLAWPEEPQCVLAASEQGRPVQGTN